MGKIIRDTDVVDKSLSDALKKLEKSLQNIVNSLNAVADSSKKVNIQTKQSQQTFSKTSDNINKASQNSQQLTALEKERIRVQKQLQATLAKSLSIRENNAKTLAKGKALLQARNKALKQAAELQFLNSKEGKKLNEQIKKQNQELRKSKQNSQQLTALEKERIRVQKQLQTTSAKNTSLQDKNTKLLTNNNIQLQARNKLLKKQAELQFLNSNEGKKYLEELKKQDDQLKKIKKTGGGFNKSLQNMAVKFVAVFAAVKGFIAGIKNLTNLTKEINKQTSKVAATFNLTRKEASTLTKEIRVLSSSYGKEFNDVLKSANILSKEFGITGSEALDLINQGFEKGADINGEYLELLKEYPAQLKTVGLNAEQTIAIITQTERAGVFSDKGIDAIKEAGIRLRELTPATRAALNAIGLSSSEIEKSLRDGSKSLFEITQDVSRQLGTLPDQSKEVGQAIADIFGGPGEDVGLRFLTTLKDIDLELNNVDTTLSDLEQSQVGVTKSWENFRTKIASGEGIISKTIIGINNLTKDLIDSFTSLEQSVEFGVLLGRGDIEKAMEDGTIAANKQIKKIEELTKKGLVNIDELAEKTKQRIKTANESITKAVNESDKNLLLSAKTNLSANEQILDFLEKREKKEKEITEISKKAAEIDAKERDKLNKELSAKRISEIEQQFEIELNKQKELLLNEQITRERFANWLINREIQTQEELLEISTLSAKERLKIESELLNKKLELKNQEQEFNANLIISEQEIDDLLAEDEKEQAEETKRLNDEVTKNKLENLGKEKEAREAEIAETINLANSLFEFSAALRERELSDLEIQKENELALAGDNTKEREKIEEKFAKKEAEIKRKQLISDKAQAIFNAIVNTAVAVTKVFATLGPLAPLVAGLIAAQGAAQVATIAARPLPKFAEGVQDFSGGLAMVGDEIGSKSGHSRELLNIPGKGLILSPDQPTIMNLPKGSDVIPNLESELILKGGIQSEKLDELIKSNNRVENAINNRPEHIFNATDKGFEKIVKTKNAYIKYKDTYLRK